MVWGEGDEGSSLRQLLQSVVVDATRKKNTRLQLLYHNSEYSYKKLFSLSILLRGHLYKLLVGKA